MTRRTLHTAILAAVVCGLTYTGISIAQPAPPPPPAHKPGVQIHIQVHVVNGPTTHTNGGQASSIAECPEGMVATGGGATINGTVTYQSVGPWEARFLQPATGWIAAIVATNEADVSATAICALGTAVEEE